MANDVSTYVEEIQAISAVPHILETVASLTGLGFVAIAHVTDHSWTTCAVLDKLEFGLKLGDTLDVSTTLCDEVRSTAKTIVIDHVHESAQYRDHPTPRMYGFESYFSVPVWRRDGSYFGTLCGLDPSPMQLSTPATVSTLELFAQLISTQLETERMHAATRSALLTERETAELREQFIAVLGHDLRTPLSALQGGIDLLNMKPKDAAAVPVLQRMRRSVGRMSTLVDDLVDFTRGRMGGGIPLQMRFESTLELQFGQVIAELRDVHPEADIVALIQSGIGLRCDPGRLGQLLSNLLKNAIVHGLPDTPIHVLVTCADQRFFMSVTNDAPHLPAQAVPQLFKPFWRAPASTGHEGLGLGLYIVAEIARAHGGAVDVASFDGKVCFTFAMPVKAPLASLRP